MEDAKIVELQDGAVDYVHARDKRQLATEREVQEKTKLLALMKKHAKTRYAYKGVSIEIIPEGEKLKVRIEDQEAD